MKKFSIKLLVAVLGLASGAVMAQESPWLVRARAVHIDTANKSDPVGGVGAANLIRVRPPPTLSQRGRSPPVGAETAAVWALP